MAEHNVKASPSTDLAPARTEHEANVDVDMDNESRNGDKEATGDAVTSSEAVDAPSSGGGVAEEHTSTAESTTANGTPASASKDSKRRKSSAVPEHKTKKVNKKASKQKITHTDARPGDYFYVHLKGYPQWPVIIPDEDMLPEAIVKTTPVSAKRGGVYKEQYADGGNKVNDRSFPVMFLGTNDFYWVQNTMLIDLDLDTVGDVNVKNKKALASAHSVAAEKHDLEYFRTLLKDHAAKQTKAVEEQDAKEAKKASKSKSKGKDFNNDTEMIDAGDDVDGQPKTPATASAKKSKKRKAEEDAKDSESTKKPRTTIKLNTNNTPKTTNGTSTPKSTKEPKSAKDKSSKPNKTASAVVLDMGSEGVEDAAEPEMSAAAKHEQKQKEILYVRHRLQKGLLDKGRDPKAEEMPAMHDWLQRLEKVPNMEGSIIAGTKINKLLKAIVKMNNIPENDQYDFKGRSAALLEQWNQTLNIDNGASTNGHGKPDPDDAKPGSTAEKDGDSQSKEDAVESKKSNEDKQDNDNAADQEDKTTEKEAPTAEAAT